MDINFVCFLWNSAGLYFLPAHRFITELCCPTEFETLRMFVRHTTSEEMGLVRELQQTLMPIFYSNYCRPVYNAGIFFFFINLKSHGTVMYAATPVALLQRLGAEVCPLTVVLVSQWELYFKWGWRSPPQPFEMWHLWMTSVESEHLFTQRHIPVWE